MSTHNIGFYEDLTKLSLNYHQISSNAHLISSAAIVVTRCNINTNKCNRAKTNQVEMISLP